MTLPTNPVTATKTIPSYLYFQYLNDQNLPALISAYNQLTQNYVDWFVNANLPIYTQLSGKLLDWIGAGVYGLPRPNFSFAATSPLVGAVAGAPIAETFSEAIAITSATWSSSTVTIGLKTPINATPTSTVTISVTGMNPTGYNGYYVATVVTTTQLTYPLATNPGTTKIYGYANPSSTVVPLALTTSAVPSTVSNIVVTDDIYKRILTWQFYKGDGMDWSIPWFKRRIYRFLNGTNGIDVPICFTRNVSVTFVANTDPQQLDVQIYTTDLQTGYIFAAALENGVLNVPFRFVFFVTVSTIPKLHLDNPFTPLDLSALS